MPRATVAGPNGAHRAPRNHHNAMGWGLNAKRRLEEFEPDTIEPQSEAADADVGVIDGNAMFRAEAVGASPLRMVVQRVLGRVLGRCRAVLVCFDNPEAMPELRAEVAAQRGARPQRHRHPADDEIAELREHGRIPGGVTWDQLFAFSDTKSLAFRILYGEVCRQAKAALADEGLVTTSVTVTDPSGRRPPCVAGPAESPFVRALTQNRYGEAEAQMVVAIRDGRKQGETVVVHTIDTDILLQLLGIHATQVKVCLSKAWRTDDGEEHRTKAMSIKHNKAQRAAKRRKVAAPTLVWKQYSMDRAMLRYGKTRVRVANAQLWLLAAGGVDYCGGLGGFGWYQGVCLKNARSEQCVVEGEGDTLVLCVGTLARALLATRSAVRRNADTEAFVEELCRLVYCWRYYNWAHPAAPDAVAGPAYDAGVFGRPEEKNIAQWLQSKRNAPPLELGSRPDGYDNAAAKEP